MKQKTLQTVLFVVGLTVLAGACAPAADGSATVTARGGTAPSVSTTPRPDSTPYTDSGPAGSDVDSEDLVIREIQITGINVRILESYPYQLRVQPMGFLSGCDKLHGVAQRRDGNTITISVTASSPKGAVCIAQVTDYEGDIALEGGFLSGGYTITVNGFTTKLTL